MIMTYPKGTLAVSIGRLRNVNILFCEVVFGTPGKRCEGSGLCRIYTVTGAKRLAFHPRRLPAILLFDAGGHLHLRLRQEDVPATLQQEVFQGESFLLEEDFTLPRYFARKLNAERLQIPAGAYPLRQRGAWLDIDLG